MNEQKRSTRQPIPNQNPTRGQLIRPRGAATDTSAHTSSGRAPRCPQPMASRHVIIRFCPLPIHSVSCPRSEAPWSWFLNSSGCLKPSTRKNSAILSFFIYIYFSVFIYIFHLFYFFFLLEISRGEMADDDEYLKFVRGMNSPRFDSFICLFYSFF